MNRVLMNRVLYLVVLLWGVAAAGCVVNPVTGEKELSLVSSTEEIGMGDAIHPGVIYEYDGEYQDPELKRYLGSIVMRLHRVSHRADMPIDFKILNASLFNAFAIPGHVYVTRGALARMRNEAEFAAVMGHEMAHYTARHSASQMSRSRLLNVGLGLGAGAASLFLPENSAYGDVALGLGTAGVKLAQLHYGRSQEEQADRVGTYYLYRAGYEPARMIDMQQLLQSLSGGGEVSWIEEYFSTHPRGERRVQRIQEVIQEYQLDDGRHLQGDGTFAERWQRRLKPLRDRQPAFDAFDQAQALAGKKEYQKALEACRRAQKLAPGQAPFHRLEGDLLRLLGQPDPAQRAYRDALQIDPRYQPAARGLGGASLAASKFADAEKAFREAVRLLPSDLDSRYGLGLAAFKQDRFQDAAQAFEAVVAEVAHAPTLAYLGISYEKLGRKDDAVKAYQACVQTAGEKDQESEPARHARTRLAALGVKSESGK